MTKYKPLYALYKGLKEHGTDLPDSYGSFERSMTQAGNAGASNRRNFYQSLKDSNYDVPDTYEKFYESMFVPVNNTTSRARKIGETPMTEEDRKGFTLGAQDIRMNASKFAAGDALRYNKLKQRKQKQRKDFGRVKVGTNKTPYAPTDNVVKDEGLNTYVTSDSSDTTNLDYAQQKQAVLDEQNQAYMNAIERGDIPMASETIDKNGLYDLQENIGKDGTEVTEKGIKEQAEARLNVAYQKQKDIMAQLSAAMDGGFSTFEERMQLSATKNKIDEEVRNLEALAGKESSGFWNTLADVANTIPLLHNIKEGINYLFGDDTSKDMYKAIANSMVQSNWDFGVSDIQNSVKLEQIRDKINKGEAVTKEEKEFLDANQKADKSAEWVDQYGSRAYRWTSGAGVSVPYMIDFYITGDLPLMRGMTQAFGRGAMKIAAKRGWGKLAHNIMYYTGVAAGDIIGSYAMATTVQGLKTGSDVLNRHLGTLYQDEKGNYAFGTFDENGNLLHEGGESFGKALYKGVTAAMLENYTEKMFGHWHLKSGAFDLLDKNPYTKKLADFFRGVGNKNWYLDTKKFSSKFGIGSYPEEVAEEIVNIPLNAWLVGDNSIKELGDRKTWEDIAGSMAISVGSMAGMASTPHIVRGAANQGIKAYDFAAFYVFKNRLNQANQRASEILGDEWEVIKNRIDSAPNENLGKISADLHKQVSEGKYSEEQLDAAWAYIQNLRVMRGYNLAKTMEMQAKAMTGDENTPADIRQKQLNAAYAAGQETEGENKHLAQVEYEKQKFNLASALGVSDSELENMTDEQISSNLGLDDNLDNVIYNYQNAKALYDGIMDNAQNAVDTATKVAAQRVDAMTNVEDGTIKQALVKGTMGKDDYPVYVISGNIETHDDGIINYSDSDSMIIVYNVATGRKETIPVSMLSAVNPYIQNAEEFKAQAVNEAKEKTITELSNVIDGKLVDGSQFTMEDAQGQIHEYKIEGIDEQGNCIISVDGTILPEPLSLDAIQQQYDQSNVARSVKNDQTAQEPEQIQQESQPIEDNFDYAKITNENDGKVKRVDVTDEEGKNRFPNAKAVFLIQDKGAMPKFVVMDEEGNLTSYVGKRGDKIHLKGEMTIDEYKKQRQEGLQMIAAENADSSMIEDNSGTIGVEDNTQPLSETDADNVISQMESSAETAPDLELTPDNWTAEFGEDGILSTPVGDVKMGENQVAKLFEKGRSKEFGMIKPTLTNPDVIIEVPSHSADGNEERSSSYLFIKTFLGKNGKKVYYFKSVTIKKDGLEISISSHYDRVKRVKEALMKGKLLYRKNDGAQTEQNQPSTSVTTSQEDAAGSSESKDTNISSNGNENNESLTFEDGTPIPVDVNGEVDLSQTDATHAAEWYDNNLGEDADDWLDGEIKKAKKVLKQAKNKKLAGTKPSELVASKKEKEAAIADAQAHYDSAISIRDSLKERRIAKEENTSEGRRNLIEKARRKFARLKSAVKDDAEAVSQLYRETIGSLLHRLYDGTGIDVTDTTPLTAEEYVASNLGAHSLNYEGTETSKGVKQETGLSREDFAKTQLLAADGKGTTIDALVHSLWENRPSNLESLDTQDIRNALIGVLNSGFKASEARNFVENIRIAQAENILEEKKRAQENAAYAEQHKVEPEAELKAKSDEKAELKAKSEEKLDNESSNESNDLGNDLDNEKTNDNINDNINTPEVPEDATEENPLGAQRDSAPFSPKDNTKVTNSSEERKAMVKKNAVRSEDVLDHSIGKKMRKSLSRIAKMMGADIIYLHSADSNGWYDEKTNTIYLALDSADVLGTQFVFGHEMTHEIKAKNPAAFEELKNLVKNMMGEDAFNTITDKTQQKYEKGGATYWKDRNAMEEEVVADQIGNWIHDANYAHTLMMKMSHPLLAKLHEIVNRIRFAFTGTEYSDNAKLILRSIEQAYMKTANGQVTNSETGEDVSFSLRQKPEPKKKGIGYKVFVLKDGKLYPPMVANPDGAATPVGVWLDADAAPIAGESKTGRPQVKQGGKGTQGGSGKLAYRPGWHLGVVPYAIQFNRKDAEGNKTLFPKNFVFAEVEYAADVDYQEEARQEGINPSGKYQHSLAGLKHLPTDGYYMYRTNPNPETDPWVITGAMKVNRILTRAEQADLVSKAGREPQQIQEGDIVTDDVVNSINQEIADAPKFSLKTYHGTGANFDRFDTSHAYEGAGSETFGHGIYVTKSAKIGASYALNAKVKKIKTPKAFKAIKNGDNWFGRFIDNAVRSSFAKAKKETFNRMDELIKEDENIVNDETKPEWKKNAAQKELADFDKLKSLFEGLTEEDIPSLKRAKANRYEVEIPDDTGNNYLDWNKPMKKEQKKIVREGLEKLGVDVDRLVRNGYSLDKNFGDVYNGLLYYALNGTKFEERDSFVASSNFLSSLGFTGIKYYAGTIWGGAKKGDLNYVIFNEDDAKIVGNTKFSLKKVNDAFNQRLDELVKNPNQKDKILRLGRSSSFLKAGGIADAEIELDFDKLMRKSKQGYVHEHPFDATDVKDLPMAIANPISVFDNTNGRNDGQVILTELKKEDRNFIVAIQTENQNRKGGVVLKVNKIVTLFPKDARGVINWFNQGKATNIDKEKALHFIEALQNHSGTTITDEELKSAANIINSFETTKENGEKVDVDGTKFSLKDEEYLKAVEDGNMEKAQKMVNEAADAVGYSTDSSYQGTSAFNGAAPFGNGYFLTKDERKEAWDNGEFEGESTLGDYINDDIDGGNLEELTNAASYRAADPMRKEAIDNVRNAIQKKAKTITMYRSVPSDVKEGSFRNGVWVTPSRAYAVDNAKLHGWGDDYNIIEQKVPVDDVWFDGNDIAEWGYGREENYINDTDFAYKNSKNNKKLLDAVTYDDNGNVIPLSQRFNEKNNDVRFSLKDEKTMFGMHNISVDKLRKAIKQGGFAAPSMGVVDSKNGIYSDYGEITLIPKAEKLSKRTGKNAGTFTADAWTPTYPQVERIMNKQGEKAFNTDMNVKLGDVDNGIYSNVRESWKGYLSSGDVRDGLYWHYLFDKGMNPETIYQTGKYDNDITNEVMRISDNGNKTDYTDKEVAELIQLMNKATGKDNDVDAQREKLKARIASAEKQGNHLLVALKKKRLEELEGVENFYIAADFVNDVVRNNRKNGKVDVHDTMGAAKKKVEDNKKLSDDFPSWLDKKTEEYGVEEMLYNGTTPSGKPKYIPNTIENAVKLMKKQGVAGGYTAFGSELGVFIAKNSPEVNTLAAMKNAKDKLIPFGDERHNQIKDKITKEFLELSDEIRVGSNNRYAFDDSGVSRMVELTDHKGNEKEYLKKAYNIEVSDEWMDRYNKLLDTIKKDYKVFYFETKFMRPYGLDEFEKAIVPSDTPSDVIDALKKAGIDVSSYERGNAEDRQKVTMDAINSSDNIRFSLAGERGAAAADKAEERTFRMDNLSVARKMEEEKKDAKAIKMATGWERGADGKWRYEMPDAKIKDTMDVGGGHIVKRYEDDMLWNGGKLFDVIDAPELFKAYPQLKGVRIDTDAIMNDMPSHGEYDSKTNTITIHADELKYMNDILNHEIQHAIQGIEGFATGGSPTTIRGEVKKRFNEVTKQIKQLRAEGKEDEAKALIEKNRGLYDAYMKNDDFNSYKSLAGEVEARNVQERLNMTPEERRKTLAESTEDVARKDQIFLGVGDVSFSLRDMADGKESGAADMAEDLKSLNTPDEVDDAIKAAIEDMPSGWKMANKKMIHIAQALGENRKAEIAGEEPKFSLKDGTLIKAGTYFSGGGLVEEGLKGIIDPVVAVEYDEKISGVYRNNFGQHIVTADVRDVDPKELVKQIDGEVEYFHASPVCKNYSQAKSNHAEVELDKETAASTAEFINAVKPKVVTIENVKGYKDSDAMKIITDALDANGYTWDADVYNAADYGGYTNRERLIVRAVRDGKLPAKPEKMARKSGWYEAVADIIPTLTEKKNGVAPWMDIRLKADGIDWRNIDKPLYVMGSAYADGKIPHAFADELLPTLRTKSGDVIVMPDGKVYRAMGRVLARVSGVSDDYKMPFSENLSHIIIGNGIPTQLTEHVIAPLLQNILRPTTPDEGNTKFSLRGSTPYGKQMEEWMEKNHLEKGAVPMEKPIMKEGENIFDYANRMVEWTRNQNLWKTAPKQTGFQDALDKWKADNGLSPDAYPPVRPHRENYSTEIGYAEDLEEYNKKKELWKSAPKPKNFDLSVDLEDMNKQLRNIRRAVLNQKNYDQRTVKAVSDLVRKMLNIGWGDGLSRGKVGNLLSAAKNATGANDVKKYLDKAMGILAENYLNRLSTAYDNLINTKGARADQSGVIKIGSLDANGQAFMSEYKKAINMDDSSLNTYIANIEEDSAKNEDNVEMNDYRLAGIQAAIMYKQQIGGNDADIAELKRQIGELKNKKDATKEDKDLLKSLEKKLFENKFDRITMYENLLNNIQRMVKESKGRAKEFREEITEHKNEILHRANLDLEGVDSTYYDTTTAKKKLVNNDLQRAVFSSTYTFEQFLKFFGKKAANGEGYLYNYFTKLNQDALDEEQLYNEMNRNALDEKTKELFGKEKFMKLVGIDGKGMKEMDVEVTDYSNKETGKRTIHLKQGQMLYIYLVNKETDGEMKLRAMGITEEDVAAIEENLDPRVKAMGEWLQDEYLPECQRRYQATHTKYFGAPMKEVENYFPLAINNRARNVKEDVNQDSDAMSQLAGTSTGAIVTRRVNVIPLDIENADAFEVAFNHLQEMEEWSAMLPFRQDINTLLSYTHFRNQVQNMSSVAYGSGKTLWDEFKQTAQIAAGTYKPKVNAGMMDSRIAAAMGGIAVAKISGRLWTAIKQSQSATVFLPECDFTRFVKNGVNPYGSWKWAMENIPDFRKRVENMTYGDVKLRQYLDELEKWHDWTKTISKIGMAPNILVDGITCAVGARSVYETEVNRLTKLGYPKEKAEEKAYYKAVAAYNKTQQSSGGMYLSPMQVDRTYVSAALSLFKNANYAYGRMQIEACRGLARTYDLWGGKHKTTLIESMTRQIMEEDGLDENTARAIAKATYNRTFRQSIGRLINFATLVPVSWALYKVLPYLLTGDDDDKKKDMIEEAVLKGFATSLSDNYVIPFASNILNAGLKVEDGKPTFDPEVFRYQNLYINPATSDLANIYSMVGNQKWYSVANKLGMLGVQSLIGFNPETVGALYQAFAEADYDNGNTAKEWQIGILKAISAPEESIRELYMDELGLKSGDIKKIPLAELEKRYAERQINRDNLLSQIVMDAETFNGYVDKYQKSFEKKIKDKMDKWDEYDKKKADEFFDTTSDPKLKDMIEKKRTKDANAAADEQIAKEGLNQEKKGKEPSEEAYDAVKMSIDVAEDNAISTYNKVLNKRYAALNDEYNNQTDAMKYIFMSKHPNFKSYKDLESEYTTYGKKMKELKEKLVSADGYDAKQTILKQIRAEREKFSELQSKVR